MKAIQNRLHRVVGQITTVEEMIAKDAPCASAIPQLLAAKGALDAAVQAYLEAALDTCVEEADPAALKRVIKMFIKHVS